MMQLWIDGNLVGDISGLRTAFRGANGDCLDALCAELLDKLLTGKFTPWLSRCLEARHRRGNCDRKQDATWKIEDLEECRIQLEQEAASGALSDAGVTALAKICGLSEEVVRNAERSRLRLERHRLSDEDWWRKVEHMSWWQELDNRTRADLKQKTSRLCMAINTEELALAIRHAQHNAITDIHLFRVERPFRLDDISTLKNMRILGYGRPVVLMPTKDNGRQVDLDLSAVRFEHVDIVLNGVQFLNSSGHLSGVNIQE